ncbi:MAG: S-layer homology domain-containing protein [Clostridiales bacterium]|nr:S-layer homology domain-containing protein [Clostridiales bacterium]
MKTKVLRRESIALRAFALLLCLALAVPLPLQAVSAADPGGMGGSAGGGAASAGEGAPVLLVTGQDIIAGGTYTAENVSWEKSYTLDELKAFSGPGPNFYSSVNSSGTKRIYIGEGVDVAFLLSLSGYEADSGGDLAFVASDGYIASFNGGVPLNKGRKYFPNIGASVGEADDPADAAAMLAWETGYATAPGIPGLNTTESPLRLLVGQTDITNQNNGLFNQRVKTVQAGAVISEKPISVAGKAYTRAEILMMPRVAAEYMYSSSGGDRTDRVRGVQLTQLLEDAAGNSVLEFHAADGYAVDATGMTKGDLADKNAVLAYELWNDEAKTWEGIYNTAKSGPEFGYFRLYMDGERPAQMIDSIIVKQASRSEYKHVSYDGPPYKLDAITSATLTVEGPGVAASTPISVQQLEETADGNIYKGIYSDSRGSGGVAFSYEGVKLLSILDGLVNSAVQTLDSSVEVVFKNRWRQETGRISYSDVASAKTPLIMAYGTASADEAAIPPAPFVFSMGAGENAALGNGDGPLKLVYDQGEFPGLAAKTPKFSSVAYLYIEEGTPPPGFKHMEATDDAYSNKANTEYLVTLTGGALGREVSYTVSELEAMVEYENGKPKADGKGHRDEYGLSNTTYWYVNEYEGVKLWELLTGIGVDAEEFKDDDSTLVSFSAWDNYQISAAFSMKQLAHPELFYFYEKSPLDISTDRPTKEQLATAEYQPGNQGDDWTVDGNGYPVKRGYPVLLAYGLNGYPYVRDANLPGYKSGLGNSGGPMRVIYGKTDGLNRSNPNAIENYAYFFNNGSQQLQRVQEVYVGDSTRYSTHLENPAAAYQDMKNTQALTVEIVSGGITVPYIFTLAELESILYGPGVSKRDRDNERRKEKGYYFYKVAGNGDPVEDLFEGVSLEYLLAEHIGMQGSLGSVELYSGGSAEPSATYNLADIGGKGQNSMRNTGGLGMMVAFAKNGYPMVSGSGSAGYVSDDLKTGKTIKNSGGPLQFVRAQTAVEYEAGTIDNSDAEKTSVENLTKIVVRLDADTYAHVGADYAGYAAQNVLFSGAVAIEGGVSISIGSLETRQRYMVTGDYMVGGTNRTYRGLDLLRLLSDRSIGASALMNEVTVKNAYGQSKALTVEELAASGNKVILAYGTAGPGGAADGKPLVPGSDSIGFDPAYQNSGGPLRLVIDNGAELECISNVSEIAVGAATLDGWKHNSGNFAQYAGNTLEITGQNLKNNKIFTVADLEAMDNIVVFDAYQMGGPTWVQGVDLFKLLQNIGFAGDMEASAFTANSIDNYPITFTSTQLKDGINEKPILVAFGQGTSQTSGLPLVPNDSSPGYDPSIGNAYGPLRLVVNDNTGWCVKWLTEITVGAAGGTTEPKDDFTLYPGGENGLPQASIRSVALDGAGGAWVGTNGAGMAYISGAGEITGYRAPELKTDYVTGVSIATDGSVWFTQGGSVGSQTAPPSAHFGFARYKDGEFTFYDSKTSGSTLVSDCVYGIDTDAYGNVWVAAQHTLLSGGMEGGLTKFNTAANTWQTWTMKDGLPTVSAWAVKADGAGGAWVTTYRTSNVTLDWPDESYAHVSAGGVVAPYAIPAGNDFTWSRSVATDPSGGTYITRMSGAHDPENDGGWLDYILPGGDVRSYRGDDLIPDLKAKGKLGFYPEIRTVFVDGSGGLWLSTNGLGVYRCSVSDGEISITDHYSSETGSWPTGPFDDVWSISVSAGGTVFFGSNGGLACTEVALAPPTPTVTVLDPPFTIKQSGKADIAWVIGGSGNSIKNLADNAGKIEKMFMYDGAERKVRGALLSTMLAASGISGANVLVTLNTTDGFQRDNYKNIPLADIAGQEYFVAYDLYNPETESWDKIADVDSNNVQASLRIYRNFDAGASGNRNNEVKGLSGITVTSSSTDPGTNPGASYVSVGGATPEKYDFKIIGSVEKPVYFTIEGLKNRYSGQTKDYYWLNSAGSTGTDIFTGVYLESLLKDAEIVKLKNAASINIAAIDGFSGNFNLDASSFGVYGTAIDGNKMMLAWRGTNSRTDRNIVDFSLPRLAIGQMEAGHINRSSWISDIVTITVNSSPTSNPGAKGNYAQTIENQETPLALIMKMSTTIKADTVVQDGVANVTNTKESVGIALNELKTKADGNAATTNLLRIDATAEDDAYKTVYTLPADALHLITSDGKTNVELVASQGSIRLSAEQLKHLDNGGNNPLIVEIEKIDAHQDDLAAVNIAVRMGNTAVIDFGDVLLMVGMPFSLGDSMQVESIVAYYLAENGEKSLIKLAAYDAGTKSMKLGISHLGEYSIGYNPATFTDIKKHWGKSSIEFLAARDIVNGRSADAFDPEGKVTRAEFVKMLAESVDGIDVAGATNAQFSDVLGSAWYAAYVNWAASLGIAQGNPDGTFQPNGLITREQMATMAERFMQAMKFDLAAVQNPAGFTDQDQIASYAKAAISHMQQYGILNGNPDGSFNPKGTATRAESAKVIKVYIEGVLS